MDERKDKGASKLKKFIAGVFITLGVLYQLLIFSVPTACISFGIYTSRIFFSFYLCLFRSCLYAMKSASVGNVRSTIS